LNDCFAGRLQRADVMTDKRRRSLTKSFWYSVAPTRLRMAIVRDQRRHFVDDKQFLSSWRCGRIISFGE
jgi:hypothetical protein